MKLNIELIHLIGTYHKRVRSVAQIGGIASPKTPIGTFIKFKNLKLKRSGIHSIEVFKITKFFGKLSPQSFSTGFVIHKYCPWTMHLTHIL